MRPFLALLLTLGLAAQDRPWRTLPAQGGAPEIHYRLSGEGQGLRLEVRPGSLDTSRWALHLWIGDPRMVAARKRRIQESLEAVRRAKELMKDPAHQDPDCKATVTQFLQEAEASLAAFRGYDPYAHVRVTFAPAPERGAEPRLRVLAKPSGPGLYAVTWPFQGSFDLADAQLPRLSVGLACVPAADASRPPLLHPLDLALPEPWQAGPDLTPAAIRLRLLLGPWVEGQAYLWRPGGYVLGESGSSSLSGCFGADGTFESPALWEPLDPAVEKRLPTRVQRFRFSYREGHGNALLVEPPQGGAAVRLDLSAHLSSEGEEGLTLLDGSDAPDRTFLLLQVTGASRPGSPMGYCGGGEEVDLLWLALGRDGRIQDLQDFLIDSCFKSLESAFNHPDQGPWTWAWDDPDRKVHVTLAYDPAHPERGLSEQEKPTD